jgi:DNA-binding transcriptional regulator YhcF (GntR family)
MAWNHTDVMHYVFDSGAWERLTKNTIRVYLKICQHYSLKERKSYPSYNKIADDCNLSRITVIRGVKTLKEEGLIVVERNIKRNKRKKQYSHNTYRIPDYLLREIENKRDVVSEMLLRDIIKQFNGITAMQKSHENHISYITNIFNSLNSLNNTNKDRTSYVSNEGFKDFKNLKRFNPSDDESKKLKDQLLDSLSKVGKVDKI